MLILTLRTDKPESEIGIYKDNKRLDYVVWSAHRELSGSIHRVLEEICTKNKTKIQKFAGIVIFEGPGSYTGLRIGFSVGNALADSLNAPIVGSHGDAWQAEGIERLIAGENGLPVTPEYGQEAVTSTPSK